MEPPGRQRPLGRRLLALLLLLQLLLAVVLVSYLRSSSRQGSSSNRGLATPQGGGPPPTPPTAPSSNLTILLWTWPYGHVVPLESCFRALGVPDCHFTADRSRYPEAQAVLVHHHDVYLDAGKMPREPRPPSQRWIWYSPEPPTKHPVPAFMDGLFNLTMSYRRDADIPAPYGWLEPLERPQEVAVPAKSKLVAWVVSNWAPWYVQPRVSYYQELRRHLPVDVYGRGHLPLPAGRLLPVLSQYKFYLAFENSRHQDYISEKLWRNAFLSGAVPVVMGPPRANYESHVPPDSFIHVDDFSHPRELAAFLRELDRNATRYRSYFRWRTRWRSVNYPSWGYQFCKACRALQQRPLGYQAWPELSKWYQ